MIYVILFGLSLKMGKVSKINESVARSAKEIKTHAIPQRNYSNLNLNLGLHLLQALSDNSDSYKEVGDSGEDDRIMNDASSQTATAAASTEVDSDIKDL